MLPDLESLACADALARTLRFHAAAKSRFLSPAAFSKRKAEEPACREQIAEAIRAVTGSTLRLAYALSDEAAPAATAAPALSEDELIERFMREFDAEELPADQES